MSIDLKAIEEQLAEIRWRLRPDGDASEAAEHAAAEARASVLNLVAVTRTTSEQGKVAAVLEEMAVHHPSRTLILLAQEQRASPKLEASVSASVDGRRRLSCEQVFLHAHGPVAEHLASTVAPLLIPDLPAMLWWLGRPNFDGRLFNELADLCDRLIVDSDDGFDPERDFPVLAHLAQRDRGRIAVGDFNWARLLPWRQVTAGFFDPPTTRHRLRAIRSVDIWWGGQTSARPVLLAGWLRSRLEAIGVEVRASLHHDPAAAGLARLVLATGPDQATGRFTVAAKGDDCLTTEMHLEGRDYPGGMLRIPPRGPADLLAIELVQTGHDRVYEEALAAAVAA